ncbi:MAG: aldose epimerase family protein [Verrucomicrobiia bacterium]
MKKIMQYLMLSSAGLGAACFVGCASMSKSTGTISQAPFGKTTDGTPVEIYTLRNYNGMEARIMTYGGIVVSLKVPDKKGEFGDVVLGYDNLGDYVRNNPFFGALVGRYGNRIAKGKFTLDGKEYTLAQNNAPNNLHGGPVGFDKKVWKVAKADVGPDGPRLELTLLSPDADQGFPGNLKVTVTYTLTDDNGLRVDYTATTDKDTICNLTQHSYFNLAGKGDILNHQVFINADKFTPVDDTLIPTGELKPVAGTPFDFRTATAVGIRIDANDEQIKFGHGYDHNWVINKPLGKLGLAARVTDPATGRAMEVWSTEPGVQFYTGNFLDGSITGKGGWVYELRNGLCFEPQHYPDSPNHPQFPSAELKPGQTYQNTIEYKFSVE